MQKTSTGKWTPFTMLRFNDLTLKHKTRGRKIKYVIVFSSYNVFVRVCVCVCTRICEALKLFVCVCVCVCLHVFRV